MTALLAAIPPPPFSEFHLGPLTIRMYGIMIGLGVLAATWLCGKLMTERNVGDTDDAAAMAVWGVVFGVIGARLYHVVTEPQYFRDHLTEIPMVWKPGLGIPGGILFGAIAGVVVCRRRGVPVLAALSCAAPAIPLAQSIGRWGNYFNQELYGRETTLPWGLKVDAAHRIAGTGADVLYHPTFLYESLWNLGLCLLLVWVFRNVRLQPGRLFPLYMIGYGFGRLWIEALRIDPANTIGPFRVNIWMSLALILGGLAWFIGTRNSTARWPRPATVDADGQAVVDADADVDAGEVDDEDDSTASDDGAERSGDRVETGLDEADADTADVKADARADVEADVAVESTADDDVADILDDADDDSVTSSEKSADEQRAGGQPTGTKAEARKPAATTPAAKKPSAKKSAAKKSGDEQPDDATPAEKKSAGKKAAPTKSAPKKSPAKKAAAKKSPAKKSAAKKSTDKSER